VRFADVMHDFFPQSKGLFGVQPLSGDLLQVFFAGTFSNKIVSWGGLVVDEGV